MTEQHIKSAIIGHYRNGASFNHIAAVMNLKIEYVIQVIQDYLKHNL